MSEGVPDRVHVALEEALREQRLRVVASLIRTTGDWDLAEDAVADAAERALLTWPRDGVPDNPAAWLTTTARRRAVDLIRRRTTERRRLADLAPTGGLTEEAAGEEEQMDGIEDDRLRLVMTCCHPALAPEARAALTLKVVAGMSTAAVGRSFLVSEATMGQRLLRAKRRIAHAGIPYRVPPASELPERLDAVLTVVYLVFTHGYAAVADREAADEAVRLGRLVVELVPDSDEARGLLALMLLQHSRRDARVRDGEPVTLEDQDRGRWDHTMVAEATAVLGRPVAVRGRYRVQAEIAAVHAAAPHADATDWMRIVSLYDELLDLGASPVYALNRALAVGMADGPEAGLAALRAVGDERTLADYAPWHAVRGELLARAGRHEEAMAAFERTAELVPTDAERRQIGRRRARLGPSGR